MAWEREFIYLFYTCKEEKKGKREAPDPPCLPWGTPGSPVFPPRARELVRPGQVRRSLAPPSPQEIPNPPHSDPLDRALAPRPRPRPNSGRPDPIRTSPPVPYPACEAPAGGSLGRAVRQAGWRRWSRASATSSASAASWGAAPSGRSTSVRPLPLRPPDPPFLPKPSPFSPPLFFLTNSVSVSLCRHQRADQRGGRDQAREFLRPSLPLLDAHQFYPPPVVWFRGI